MREKRTHQRVQVDLQTQIEVGGKTTHTAILKDLGQGGAFVECPDMIPYGSEIILVIMVPGESSPLRLPCTVRWSKPDGFGVQFGLLRARETHMIAQLLKA